MTGVVRYGTLGDDEAKNRLDLIDNAQVASGNVRGADVEAMAFRRNAQGIPSNNLTLPATVYASIKSGVAREAVSLPSPAFEALGLGIRNAVHGDPTGWRNRPFNAPWAAEWGGDPASSNYIQPPNTVGDAARLLGRALLLPAAAIAGQYASSSQGSFAEIMPDLIAGGMAAAHTWDPRKSTFTSYVQRQMMQSSSAGARQSMDRGAIPASATGGLYEQAVDPMGIQYTSDPRDAYRNFQVPSGPGIPFTYGGRPLSLDQASYNSLMPYMVGDQPINPSGNRFTLRGREVNLSGQALRRVTRRLHSQIGQYINPGNYVGDMYGSNSAALTARPDAFMQPTEEIMGEVQRDVSGREAMSDAGYDSGVSDAQLDFFDRDIRNMANELMQGDAGMFSRDITRAGQHWKMYGRMPAFQRDMQKMTPLQRASYMQHRTLSRSTWSKTAWAKSRLGAKIGADVVPAPESEVYSAINPERFAAHMAALEGGEDMSGSTRVYRYTPYGENPGDWGSTSAAQTLGRVGEGRMGGRTGTIDYADVPDEIMKRARGAAVTENTRRAKGADVGSDPREGYFRGEKLDWHSEDELPHGLPGSIRESETRSANHERYLRLRSIQKANRNASAGGASIEPDDGSTGGQAGPADEGYENIPEGWKKIPDIPPAIARMTNRANLPNQGVGAPEPKRETGVMASKSHGWALRVDRDAQFSFSAPSMRQDATAAGLAEGAIRGVLANSAEIPGEGDQKLAGVQARVQKVIARFADEAIKRIEEGDAPDKQAQITRLGKLRTKAQHAATQFLTSQAAVAGVDLDELGADTGAMSKPAMARAMNDAGIGYGSGALRDAGDGGDDAGGTGRGGRVPPSDRQPQRGGLWSRMGGAGNALYGAYIAKRMWQMTAGGVFEEAAQGREWAGQMSALSSFGFADEMTGGGASSAGWAKQASQQGAYELLAPISNAYNRAVSQSNGQAAIAGAGVRLGLGSAAGVGIAGSVVGGLVPAGAVAAVGAATGVLAIAALAGVGIYTGGRMLEKGEQARMAEMGYANTGGFLSGDLGLTVGRDPNAEPGEEARAFGTYRPMSAKEKSAYARRQSINALMDQMEGAGVSADDAPGLAFAALGSFGEIRDQAGLVRAGIEAKTRGIAGATYLQQGVSYATQRGALAGTDAMESLTLSFANASVAQQGVMSQQAAYAAGGGGMVRGLYNLSATPTLALNDRMGQFATGLDQQHAAQAEQAYMTAAGSQTGLGRSVQQGTQRASADFGRQISGMGGIRGSAVLGIGSALATYQGTDGYELALSMTENMSMDQIGLFGGILAGDWGAKSYAANTGQLGMGDAGRAFDLAGNRIFETNIGQGMDFLRANRGVNEGVAGARATSGIGNISNVAWGSMSASQKVGAMTGQTLSAGASGAINQGYGGLTGSRAWGAWVSDQQYGAQMAQSALQIQGITARQQLNWGSGTWDNPSAGSLWGLEDRQRSIQWGSTQKDWEAQSFRMNLSNSYQVQQEGLQQRRMDVGRSYQQSMFGFERQAAMQSRAWTQEDYQYQDQMREMSFSWGMEDVNEQIRMSSGRQRRQLVKQRGRMVTQSNVEEEQIDKQRDRQEQTWAREDEQYQKRIEYFEETNELEDEQFTMQKAHREALFELDVTQFERHKAEQTELHKINEEMIKLNRKYQAEELERSKRAAEIAAGAAAAAHEYEVAMRKINAEYEDTVGTAEQLAKYENSKAIANSIVKMAAALDGTDLRKIQYWIKMLQVEQP